jgi:hypothetical protein
MSPYPPLQPEAPPDIAEPNCPPPALALEEVPAPTSLPLDVATADWSVSPQPLPLCPPPLAASAEIMKLLLLATNPIAITTANDILIQKSLSNTIRCCIFFNLEPISKAVKKSRKRNIANFTI